MNSNNIIEELDLKEGHLYVVKDGVFEEIVTDPEDSLRKIRIIADAYESVICLQKKMRSELGGYKPDLTMVCSSVLHFFSNDPAAPVVVRDYVLKKFSVLDKQ